MALTLSIKHQLHLMGALFSASSRFAKRGSASGQAIKDRQSILLLMCPTTSPARTTILRCIHALRTPSDPFWWPLVGGTGSDSWDPRLYLIAIVPLMITIGAIWRRFILALDCWPWRLGLLVGDFLTPPNKIALLQELKKARSCQVVSKHQIKPRCRCLDDVTLALIKELGDDEE